MIEYLLIVVVIVLIALLFYQRARFRIILSEEKLKYEKNAVENARKLLEEWKSSELKGLQERYQIELDQFKNNLQKQFEEQRKTIEEQLKNEANLKLEEWIMQKEKEIREDAINRSITILLGKISDHIAPMLMTHDLGFDPRDARFIGTPVDYVVFKGLSDKGIVEDILFIEVKTGKIASLSDRERAVRDAVDSKRVRWITYNIRKSIEEAGALLKQEVRKAAEEQTKKKS
jgi:predicted Holliday junction resolvase-like endonuclease